MAKLYFRYGAMNSGKTTALLQVAHNYEERGMHVVIMKPAADTKGEDRLISRIGATRQVDVLLKDGAAEIRHAISQTSPDCILIDEAQFLSPEQVDELFAAVIDQNIPVLAYGLRTDFQTRMFPGAQRLFELAHSLEELKTICRCGKKALLNARFVNGEFVTDGEQLAIENDDDIRYESMCGTCYRKQQIASS